MTFNYDGTDSGAGISSFRPDVTIEALYYIRSGASGFGNLHQGFIVITTFSSFCEHKTTSSCWFVWVAQISNIGSRFGADGTKVVLYCIGFGLLYNKYLLLARKSSPCIYERILFNSLGLQHLQ